YSPRGDEQNAPDARGDIRGLFFAPHFAYFRATKPLVGVWQSIRAVGRNSFIAPFEASAHSRPRSRLTINAAIDHPAPVKNPTQHQMPMRRRLMVEGMSDSPVLRPRFDSRSKRSPD